MMNQRAQAYLRTKVMTASPVELRLMLVDGAIRFAGQCQEGLSNRNFEQAFEGSRQCRAILTELLSGLRSAQDPILCQRLNSLYTFLISRMMEAMAEKNPQLIDSVVELLTYERETWQMVIDQQAAENRDAGASTLTPAEIAETAALVDKKPDYMRASTVSGTRIHLAG